MFNLFGSFFFGRPAAVEPEAEVKEDNIRQNNESTDACTQTQLTTNEETTASVANTSTSADWVIVDRTEPNSLLKSVSTSTIGLEAALSKSTTADKMVCEQKEENEKEEKEEEMRTETDHEAGGDVVIEDDTRMLDLVAAERYIQELCPTISEEEPTHPTCQVTCQGTIQDSNPMVTSSDDVLLGSFFDRNEVDEQTTTKATAKVDDWLITPLPCLTSITCSQRSIIDNDPLENLLIEHPSMSVFVSVTSSSSSSSSTSSPTSSSSTINNAEFIIMQSIEDENEKVEEEKQPQPMMKKRKAALVEQQQQQSSANTSGESSPTSTIKRKGKKNKKSSSPSPAAAAAVVVAASTVATCANNPNSNNKENMQQVKCHQAFMTELRRQQVTASKLDAILLNKNHLKRNNNKITNKFAHTNMQQRKFHKLQQPAF